ncbi:MAG TPA: bifunctional riboflavin kinase/FAD synthetase [Candidatus Paceibacterota bacterium]|nr:bifunctional riboflavin kinase/FAD synthetase [Verrucomicrobiota bacterium]HRY46914.1 bifunctional riboflavin kinase/FAD synthetase [Candidatus Paceibacterota bacterium]
MKIISRAEDFNPLGRRVCLALGVFDGVHLGHQQVIHQTISDARQHDGYAVVVTFDRHPNTVVRPDKAPRMIYPLAKRLRVMAELGLDAALVLPFDHALSQVSAEEFMGRLCRAWGQVYSVSVGAGFCFGYRRLGNLNLLKNLGQTYHFIVHGLAPVSLDSKTISSTLIRESILAGHLDRADQLLGRPYTLGGRVVQGDQLGRRLGIPTANLDVRDLVHPPKGVYAVQTAFRDRLYLAVLNIGDRPTIQHSDSVLRVEAHLLDFSGDLYGQELEVEFLARIRDEKRFASLDALQAQIQQDIAMAKNSV